MASPARGEGDLTLYLRRPQNRCGWSGHGSFRLNRDRRLHLRFILESLETRRLLSVAAPIGVLANNGATPTDLVVSWDAVSGATSYNIWRNSTDNSSTATDIAPGLTGTSYDDKSVTTGNTYYYWVTAAVGATVSSFSGEASATAGTLVFDDTFGTDGISDAWGPMATQDPNNPEVNYTNTASTLSVVTNASTADATNGSALAMSLIPNGNGTYNSSEICTAFDPDNGGNNIEYGEIQARIMIPGGTNSSAIWPAFWLMGDNVMVNGQVENWPQSGEIDVFENDGASPATIDSTLHGPVPGGGHDSDYGIGGSYTLSSQNFDAGYHIFAIQWGPGQITFSVDGNAFATETPANLASGDTWEFDGHPFFMILDVCEGAPFAPGTITSTQTMYVDYVRAYSLPAPSGVTQTPGAKSNVVAWSADPGAASYQVWRNTTDNSATATELVKSFSGTSYTDNNVTSGTSYYYWVIGQNSGQMSDYSAVASPAAASVKFLQQPTAVGAGNPFSPAITAEALDSNGLPIGGAIITLSVASGNPNAIAGTLSQPANSSGVATFGDIYFNQMGNYSLTAGYGTLSSAASTSFNVGPGVPQQLVFAQQPQGAAVGATIAPVVIDIEDRFGDLVTTDNAFVVIGVGSHPAGGGFSSTSTTHTTAVNGVATFSNLAFNMAGSYTIQPEDAAEGLIGPASSGFAIGAAPAIASFSINGGAAQRSMDTLATLVFTQPMNLNNAISITMRSSTGGAPTAMAFNLSTSDDITWTVTFPSYVGGSLPNGIFDFTISAAKATSIATGLPLPVDQTYTFHRLFGDFDGNGTVNNADYFAFKAAYGQGTGSDAYNAMFDFDGNGIVNNADYFEFKMCYGMVYSYVEVL
jgi:hypothetical protein